MYEVAQKGGLISPTGRVSEAYPKVREVLRTLDEYAHGDMSVPQMQAVRKTLQAAAKSPDETWIGTPMLKAFDEIVAQGVPQLAEAKPIYARAARGKTIEKAVLQGERKGNYKAAFSKINEGIEGGKLHGFSAEDKSAIARAAQGTRTGNALRGASKLTLRGPAALATFPIGVATKAGANAIDRKNALLAAALVKRGTGAYPLATDQQRIAQALINSGLIGGPVAAQVGQQQ